MLNSHCGIINKPKILVVGCGHSATFYISEVFQKIGVDVRHELVGKDGAAGWNYTHLLPKDFLMSGLGSQPHLFHQVRHPLKVISSLQAMEDDTWGTISTRAAYRGLKWNPLDDPHPLRGMKYWLAWNGFADKVAHYRYKIEYIQWEWKNILKKIEIEYVPIPVVPKTINKHQYDHMFTWDELEASDAYLADCVRKLSEKYGYESTGEI